LKRNPNTIIIRKYENRRLYDTAKSRYVNLEEVARMVRDGADLQVLDAATGEDITRLILTQVIVEEAKAPDSTLPLDMLRQMVIASGKITQEGVLNYAKTMMDMYQNATRAFSPSLTPFDIFQSMMAFGGRRPSTEGAPAASPPADLKDEGRPTDYKSEVLELRRRIEELERTAARSARAGTARKKPRRDKN
jgi:polyhydroxyalkanoate synthesis repressor PhaR